MQLSKTESGLVYDTLEKKILRTEKDERRGKGELMCHSLLEEETSMPAGYLGQS